MKLAIACSKVWDTGLVSRLKSRLNVDIIFITEKDQLTEENLRKLNVDRIFFPHWSYIIKPAIFNKYDCIIFHMTDLPYGRGGSPLQNLIIRGHKATKISALKCSSGIDTGPVYLKKELSLDGTAREIFQRATEIIEEMIVEIVETNPTPIEQTGEIVLFERRKPEDSNISDLNDLEKIYDHIRMLDAEGYPNAFIESNGIRFEFHSAVWKGSEIETQVRIVKK
jgi:methionyl-tRNA formyltransferase